jgi:hypothetical protein
MVVKKYLNGRWNAVSVPKLVHAAARKARQLSPTFGLFPGVSHALLDEHRTCLVRTSIRTVVVP